MVSMKSLKARMRLLSSLAQLVFLRGFGKIFGTHFLMDSGALFIFGCRGTVGDV